MANQIVTVLTSLIETINNNAEEALKRDRAIAEAIKIEDSRVSELSETVNRLAEMVQQLLNRPAMAASDDTDISESDATKLTQLIGTKKVETKPEPKAEPKLTRKAATKSAPKPEPQPEPQPEPKDESDEEEAEEAEEEIVEETEAAEEEALDNDSNPDETKSIFQSKSTGRQRIICMNYLKLADRRDECRMPDKLTWDYCSSIKADEKSSKSAMQQWLEFVVAYERTNG